MKKPYVKHFLEILSFRRVCGRRSCDASKLRNFRKCFTYGFFIVYNQYTLRHVLFFLQFALFIIFILFKLAIVVVLFPGAFFSPFTYSPSSSGCHFRKILSNDRIVYYLHMGPYRWQCLAVIYGSITFPLHHYDSYTQLIFFRLHKTKGRVPSSLPFT